MEGGIPSVDWGLVLGTSVLFAILTQMRRFLHQDASLIPQILVGANRLALWLYALVMLPGTLLHEASHAVTATALGVNVENISIFPTEEDLGSVLVHKPDPIRHTIIGLAPLVSGLVVVLLISALAFDLTNVYDALIQQDWSGAADILTKNLSSPWEWLAIYLVFVISANMFPSPSDIPRMMLYVLMVLPILFASIVSVGGARVPWLVNITNALFRWLLLIFAFTFLVDLPIMLLLTAGSEAAAKQFPGQ